eukprot:TRINITY_DN4209_c0_g1_i2.p1 TRINITY_DN4209_c0_g1~~TRINITY_DN4209_c0_g1_i2.p1  ORF type:complete len:117 (-),score=21.51 TRINITY_DN4209_c0_g1_i2:27-377(-)
MLQPKVLPRILEQANTDGVKATILLNRNGLQLATSGEELKAVSAIYANIWNLYDDSSLDYLLSDCEEGKIVVAKVTEKLLLCLCGDKTSQFGMLKAKAKIMKQYLEEPLKQLLDVT